MTQGPKSEAKLSDKVGEGQIGERGASITAAAATTYAAPSVTASNPTAPTDYVAVTDMSAEITDLQGEAMSAALQVLRDEVAAYETDISQIIVDNAATLVELDDLNDTVVLAITAANAVLSRLEA
ncbi:hypothetical protein LCGC14_2543980, partial [marine sediment metagenome]